MMMQDTRKWRWLFGYGWRDTDDDDDDDVDDDDDDDDHTDGSSRSRRDGSAARVQGLILGGRLFEIPNLSSVLSHAIGTARDSAREEVEYYKMCTRWV